MLTINNFNEISEKDIENIKIAIFDIDGTISNHEIIYYIIKNTFSYFNVKSKRMPQLGKEKFNIEWLNNELKIEIPIAEKIITYYESQFYITDHNKFIKNVYSDVIPFFKRLHERNIFIGFFTLRQIDLALVQIKKMGLLEYVYVNNSIKENEGLQISGSDMTDKSFTPLNEKINQLKYHHNHLLNFENTDFLVIGDSLETDIYAAKRMKFKHCLIQR